MSWSISASGNARDVKATISDEVAMHKQGLLSGTEEELRTLDAFGDFVSTKLAFAPSDKEAYTVTGAGSVTWTSSEDDKFKKVVIDETCSITFSFKQASATPSE